MLNLNAELRVSGSNAVATLTRVASGVIRIEFLCPAKPGADEERETVTVGVESVEQRAEAASLILLTTHRHTAVESRDIALLANAIWNLYPIQ